MGSRKHGSAGGRNNVDPDVEEFEAFDPDWNFLVFEEDTVPVDDDGRAIDLPTTSTVSASASNSNPNSRDNTPNNMNHTRISLGAGMSITKLDQTLHTVTQNKTSIQSHAAQQLIRNLLDGNHASAAMASHMGGVYDPSQAALRLMNGVCDVHESGALLLPGTGNDVDHDHGNDVDNFGTSLEIDDGLRSGMNTRMENAQRLDMTMEGDDDHGNGFAFDGGNDYDDHDDGGDDGGGGFVIHSAPMNDEEENDNLNEQTTLRNAAGNGDGTSLLQQKDQQPVLKAKERSPWDMLDPHDDSEAKSRPVRVAITYRLPHDCEAPPSASVTGAMTKMSTKKIPRARAKNQIDEGDYSTTMDYTSLAVEEYRKTLLYIEDRRRKSSMDIDSDDASMDSGTETNEHMRAITPLSVKGLAFGDEFLYVAKAQAKYKAAEKRRLKRIQSETRNESQNAAIANEKFADIYDDNDDDDEGGAFDFAGGDDDYSAGGNNESTEGLDAFGGVFGNEIGGDGNGNGAEHQTFEELCRAHLKEFAKGAERFAVETQMSKKVSSWQARLEVILAEEDARREFDINRYGSRVISRAEESLQRRKSSSGNSMVSPNHESKCVDIRLAGKRLRMQVYFPSSSDSSFFLWQSEDTVEFISITKDQEPYEVCRTFLASLMLCNSENVIFNGSKTSSVSSPDDLHLKVLKKDTNSPMETYLAPSVANALAKADAIMA
jgi:condensin-2 complex subunit H2